MSRRRAATGIPLNPSALARSVVVILLAANLTGCQTIRSALHGSSDAGAAIQPLESRLVEIPEGVLGRDGYLVYRPILEDFRTEPAGAVDSKDSFDYCGKVKFERLVRYTPPDDRMAKVLIEISQAKRRYYILYLGPFAIPERVESLDEKGEWLVKEPIVRGGVVKFKGASKSRKKLVCQDQAIFTGMTSGEFGLLRGLPERINRTVSRSGQHEQWVYGLREYYYFQDGILTSWQD